MEIDTSQDDIFYNILADSGQIVQFFQSLFGFLYRRTDFFKIQENAEDTFGFPPGVAENLILNIFRQWQEFAKQNDILEQLSRMKCDDMVPPAIQELEISNDSSTTEEKIESITPATTLTSTHKSGTYECYNGAVCEGYSWSQSISDLDVVIQVPDTVTRGKQVRVEITSQNLGVWHDGSTKPLMHGDFPCRIKKNEAVWSLIPGKHIQLQLEKCEEKWWDSLLTTEPKIDLKTIDPSRPLEELSQADQMKVQELVWSEQHRSRGVPVPTSSGRKDMEAVLKQAWKQENSPFKDVPYDSSILTCSNLPRDEPQ